MLRKAEHIGIMVTDMDRSIDFYTRVLGLRLRKRVRMSDVTELAFLPIGDTGTEVELICKQGATHPRDGVVNHLCFMVDDVAAVLAHLRQHNVELLNDEPIVAENLGGRIAFFRGPDGEKLELFAPFGAP
jgi:lactoylglutathione lyase